MIEQLMYSRTVSGAQNPLEFFGTVEFNEEEKMFHGKVSGLNDLVTFEGLTIQELRQEFIKAVDKHIELKLK
ncbi:hypothetical protein OAA91_00730 [Fibrobacterales bacterium]|nr:hypothetical protein [Fibrobacterales bacterium]